MLFICELCYLTDDVNYSKFELSTNDRLISKTFNIDEKSSVYFNKLSKDLDAIISHKINGCQYIRLIHFTIETTKLNLSINYIKYFNFNSIHQ
jgi:hypothetical protein